MIKQEVNKCYYANVSKVRGCSFKIEKDITMRPICSYAGEGNILLTCNKVTDEYVEFIDSDTGYKIIGCEDLLKKEVNIPISKPEEVVIAFDAITLQNHLWISLDNVKDADIDFKLEFNKSRIDNPDEVKETKDALVKLYTISETNISKTKDELISLALNDDLYLEAHADNALYDMDHPKPKTRGQKK